MGLGEFAIKLSQSAPKVFLALSRFLDEASLAQLAREYFECEKQGGNSEPGLEREEGVSFNPRMARILSLLIVDGEVREFELLRTALYAASIDPRVRALGGQATHVPQDLARAVLAVWSQPPQGEEAVLLRGVIELDVVRHLHQTEYSQAMRLSMLDKIERGLLGKDVVLFSPWLRKKLEHAIQLQRRNAERLLR